MNANSFKCFETWTKGGVRFIAVPSNSDGFLISDEFGNWYGGWQSIAVFRYRNPEPLPGLRADLSTRVNLRDCKTVSIGSARDLIHPSK